MEKDELKKIKENLKKENKTVLKRNGRRVEFEGEKIALAIKKAFEAADKIEKKYVSEDANKVYILVLKNILEMEKETIKVEEIQDNIEESLEKLKYVDVKEAFSEYREKRAVSRIMYNDQRRNHKFSSVFEANINGEIFEKNPELLIKKYPEIIFKDFGKEISKKFALSYILKRKIVEAANSGEIYIKDLEYLPMKTASSVFLNLDEIMKEGFSTGIGRYRAPKSLTSYAALTYSLIESVKKEESGSPAIPFFDKYFAKIYLENFKKIFLEYIIEYLEFTDFKKFVALNSIKQAISKIESIDVNLNEFKNYIRDSNKVMEIIEASYVKAIIKSQKLLYKAIEALIHNLNNNIESRSFEKTKRVAINIGEEDSKEALIVSKTLLDVLNMGLGSGIDPDEPDLIIKLDGKNIEKIQEKLNDKIINNKEENKIETKYFFEKELANEEDLKNKIKLIKKQILNLNYEDILIYSFEISKKRKNICYAIEKNERYITKYLMEDMAVFENEVDPKKNSPEGRGILSTTTINLPRIAIKSINEKDFFEKLDETLKLVFLQLFDRFNLQCDLDPKYFSISFSEPIWIDTDKIKSGDRLRKVLKHGIMNVGIVGLYETANHLLNRKNIKEEIKKYNKENKGNKDNKNNNELKEDEEFKELINLSEKILKFIRKNIDEFKTEKNINLGLYADDEPSRNFIKLDKTLYGNIKGITDKEKYEKGTNFLINEKKLLSKNLYKKLEYEGKMQKYTNGGNKTKLNLSKDISLNDYVEILNLAEKKEIKLLDIDFN